MIFFIRKFVLTVPLLLKDLFESFDALSFLFMAIEPAIKNLQKDPLGPFIIFRIAGSDFAAPVKSRATSRPVRWCSSWSPAVRMVRWRSCSRRATEEGCTSPTARRWTTPASTRGACPRESSGGHAAISRNNPSIASITAGPCSFSGNDSTPVGENFACGFAAMS